MTWKVTTDVERFDDAVDWFQRRVVLTSEQAHELDARTRHEAFWVGGGLQLEQVQRVFDKLQAAITRGDTFEDFRKAVRGELTNPAHTETVFRNAAQRSYNAGRYLQMMEPSVRRFRPYGMVDAILDGRTTTYCRTLNGTVVALDDPWWDTHWFPAHHRCRTSVRSLRRSEAERIGIAPSKPGIEAPAGWGQAPKVAASPWKPDPKTHDKPLVAELARKEPKTRARKPRPQEQHEPEFWEKHYAAQYGEAAPAVAWGRAAQERGLDLDLDTVETELEKLSDHLPHVREGLEKVRDLQRLGAPKTSTLRENAGELDQELRAMAGIAGHLNRIPERAKALSVPDLERDAAGRRALQFFSSMTPASVEHPVRWTFVRANGYRAYCSPGERKIQWNNDRSGVLEHEWGHSLETLNEKLAARAQAFLKKRTVGEAPEKLSALKPGYGYADHEIAKEDGFIEAYMGRWYAAGSGVHATELTSMGSELLVAGEAGWGSLKKLLSKDPETFWFVLGQLAHP